MSDQSNLSRFNLEDKIQDCWGVVQDLQTVSQQRSGDIDIDAVARLYQLKFQSLWDIFEALIKEKKI